MSEVMAPARGVVGLLVGYGSVGAHHGRVLAGRHGSLAIVDTGQDARGRAAQAHPDATVVASLDDLAAQGWDFAASRATVATWGPSHAAVVGELLDRGVRRLLVEKPMASSVADAHGMVDRAEAVGARLGIHLQRRVSGVIPGVHDLAARHGLGPLVAVTIDGGARCLVTNGMHWIDLACGLFGDLPTDVTSTAQGQAINPRAPELHFYEGVAAWRFPDARSLTIAFTNRSSAEERLRLWYRDAVIDLTPAGAARVSTRRAEDVERFPAITRTGPPSEVVEDGPIAGVLDAVETTAAIWDEIDGERPLSLEPRLAADVLGACIGALASGDEGRRIDLPIDPQSDLGTRDWPIS